MNTLHYFPNIYMYCKELENVKYSGILYKGGHTGSTPPPHPGGGMVDKVSWSTRSAALRAFLEKRELRKLKSRGVRSPSKPCKAVPSAEESESCRAEKKEMAKARRREYMRARRAFRKGHPALKEVDRLAYNAAMRR